MSPGVDALTRIGNAVTFRNSTWAESSNIKLFKRADVLSV